jgi:uncharacterized protein YaeQ
MAAPTTLYRFKIDVSDVSRGLYETLDLRAAQHPSETESYLLTRVIAFSLNHEPGLAFTGEGLGNPDEPCLSMPDSYGGLRLWIEIGNPSARKLHKASKASKVVKVFTYKNPESLLKEISQNEVHRKKDVEFYSLDSILLESLAEKLEKENRWTLIHDEGSLMIDTRQGSVQGELRRHYLP